MDDRTTAESLSPIAATAPAAPGRRRRRVLAAGALLLAVAATVSGCDSKKVVAPASSVSAASSSPSASATPSPSAPAPAPTSSAAPSAAPTPAPTPPSTGGNPPAPTAPGGGATPPENPSDPQALLKPLSYLTSGNQLTIFFFGGICDKYGLKADESKSGQVGVQVVITQRAPVGQMCPALAKRQAVAAALSTPLQGRTVVDLASGRDIPLESLPNGGPVSANN